MTQQRQARSRGKRQSNEDGVAVGTVTTASSHAESLPARQIAADVAIPPESAEAAAVPADALAADSTSTAPVRRRTTNSGRARGINFTGLGERAREPLAPPPLPLPDDFARALPALRQSLLDQPFDQAVSMAAEGIAGTLCPARAEVWIAEPAAWNSSIARAGGKELSPTLRLRAWSEAPVVHATSAARPPDAATMPRPGPLVNEVIANRRPIVLHDAGAQPLAAEWLPKLTGNAVPGDTGADAAVASAGTLLALPLRARGQFLGVLAAGTRQRLGAWHVAALAELADLMALAADREQLLSYSRGQEALAQTVVRHAPVAIAVLRGPEHTFALANPTFSRLLGREGAQPVAGKRLTEVVPERAAELAASLRLDAALHGGEHQAMVELPLHSPEHGLTYWNVTSSPLAGRGPVAAGVLVAAVDVTRQVLARQRAEEVAEMAQERIAQMMALHATSLEVASQLGADSRDLVADILRRSIALLGARAGVVYVRAERRDELEVIVSQGLRGDYAGSRIRIGEGLAGQVAASGAGLVVDDYRASPLRGPIYVGEDFRAMIAVPLRHHNRVIGVLEVLDDAERRVFTRDDLWLLDLFASQAAQAIENGRTYVELDRAYRKQRALDRMKDDFIATASHELRTPLTGVQGFLDLLHDYPGSRDEARALDFLSRAIESAQELADIAERLLQTSRLDSGRLELHIGRVRVAAVVEEVLRSYHALWHEASGVTYELVSTVDHDRYVYADLGRLKEVLDNLVGNAVKYSPGGGRVVVSCEPADFAPGADAGAAGERPEADADDALSERPTLVLPHVGDEGKGDEAPDMARVGLRAAAASEPYLVIAVSDEGMGIPEDERERLFGRFARGDSARASQIRGTGLGLYICRQIMRAMGGDIWLYASTPGAGSTFALALPAAPASASEDADAVTLIPFVSPATPGVP